MWFAAGCALSTKKMLKIIGLALIMLPVMIQSGTLQDPTAGIDSGFLAKIEKRFGSAAKQRLLDWKALIKDSHDKPLTAKLELVNDFFNDTQRISYGSDLSVWQQKDYWATPVEFLARGQGDCEDYSIAKYYTLLALGVPEQKLQITYVKVEGIRYGTNRDFSHMVLGFFDHPDAIPLILDNVITTIKSASERNDLTPVYSFNGDKLWLAKQRERGVYIGSSDRIKAWVGLNERIFKRRVRGPGRAS